MPVHFTAWKNGCTRTMTAPRPGAASAPWVAFEDATPTALHQPRCLPPVTVFLVTTAKLGPGTRTSTTANTRNDP